MPLSDNHKVAIAAIALVVVVFAIYSSWTTVTAPPTADELVGKVPVPQSLLDHTKEFDKEIIKVNDNVYVAIGYALGNSIMVLAPEGAIIVDVTESMDAAREIWRDFQKEAPGVKVKAIIYTHHHSDHIYGGQAFVDDPSSPPDVWAHATLINENERFVRANGAMFPRAMRQFGPLLPDGGHINCGIGAKLSIDSVTGYILPNKFLDGEHMDTTIAGLKVRLVHIPGETMDQIGVWIPEWRMFLAGDDLYRSFPNLYAIRGTRPRDLRFWVRSLDKMLDLQPQHLVLSHTRPITGEKRIADTLTVYRDAIQFVHDQALRYLNKGMHPDDIVNMVKLPSHLKSHPYLLEHYGTVKWSVRTVFNQYLGWFSGEPAELAPHSTIEKAKRMVELAGGKNSAVKAAQKALDNNDPQWALELATHVLKVDKTESSAKDIRIAALKTLAARETSPNGRNYYLTCALEEASLIDNRMSLHKMQGAIKSRTANELFEVLQGRVKPEAVEGVHMTLAFHFVPEDKTSTQVYTLIVRNGVLVVRKETPVDPDVKVSLPLNVWKDILVRNIHPQKAAQSGALTLEGDKKSFILFLSFFD